MDNNKIAFENVLQQINKYVSLKSEDRRIYTTDFTNICKTLLNEIQLQDPLFKEFCYNDHLSGSYVDNLKISKPDEFDIVLRIKFRFNNLIKVEKDSKKPGYIKLNFTDVFNTMKNRKEDKEIYEKLKKLVDDKNYLIQNKFQSWIEGIFTKVLIKNNYQFNKNGIIYNVKYSKCGPAHTIKVTKENRKLSIDFVPGIVFDKKKWVAKRQPPKFSITDWIAVPKPIKNNPTNENNLSFQTSYVDTERILIRKTNNLKNVLRLIKKLRDRHNIIHLKSYFIKTVFLWENDNKEPEFWNESTGKILLYMLEKVIKYVECGQMPFYWNKEENMFAPLSKDQIQSMLGQLKKIQKSIIKHKDTQPTKIYELFLTTDEINDMHQNKQKMEYKNMCHSTITIKEDVVEQCQHLCILS